MIKKTKTIKKSLQVTVKKAKPILAHKEKRVHAVADKKLSKSKPVPKEEIIRPKELSVDNKIAFEAPTKTAGKYYEAVGRRKEATARVRLFTKGNGILINGKNYKDYFKKEILIFNVETPLQKMKVFDKLSITVMVSGGGIAGQAGAVRHGISRALLKYNPDFRKRLKRAGFLRRDPRAKERRKYGLKKDRKAPQWAKR